MKHREYIIDLYDIYQFLFTKKQQEYFENYYFEDLSLSEIAQNYNISKAGIGKCINEVESKLLEYEKNLNVYKKNKIIEEFNKKNR
ncbi:MAG: DNA-binding protein [Bacilli bacterium]